jgi:predicted kinase
VKEKSILIITFGYPGSGKTYFSEHLSKEFNLFHLSFDKIRSEMFDIPTFSQEEHKKVSNLADWLIQELLKKNIRVIVDDNTNKLIQRKKYFKFANKANARYVLLHIKTPIETAEKRIIKRGKIKNLEKKKYYKPLELSVLHLLKNEIEHPNNKEIFIEINGLKPYKEQVKTFKKWFVSQ